MPVERRILLNPGPATTSQSVKDALVIPDICPRETEYQELLADVLRRLAALAGPPEQTVAIPLVGSGTTALEAALTSFVPQDGMAVIVENGVYGKRLAEMARIHGIDHVVFAAGWGTPVDHDALETLLTEHDGRATHLFFVHHETSSGLLNPLDSLTAMGKRHGLGVVVDAMSSFGAIPIEVVDGGVDAVLFSSNKCLQAMAGLALVVATRRSIEAARNTRPRSMVLDLVGELDHIEKTGQTRFTSPPQIVSALHQALLETEAEGLEARIGRYRDSMQVMKAGLREQGFQLLLEEEHQSGILVAILEPQAPWWDFTALHDRLYERGFTIYPGTSGREKTWRLSTLGDIDRQDIERFLVALAECTAELKRAAGA